ncbi:LL-diaminopimelate aminotransferase [Alkalispirochaeta alkalica]|uniref:LL-diaminopimelate aminotransferase n=1 Tax=Alkalispirochaeta alkalica TaxID=46356 RepID=UPI00035D00E1|nr:LL-diaminopimelate aminotransferase [Alkalispirochaeta alkalica]
MIQINEHYQKLKASYLFVDIAKSVRAHQEAHPEQEVIKLGIGDVTRPLPASALEALHTAIDEMASPRTFRGYGPEQGYDFLREAIAREDYQSRGVNISAADVFVSDGSKCDTGNIQELFSPEQRVAVPDPVYPVYVDTNVMAGRTGPFQGDRYQGLTYLSGTQENGFVPPPPEEAVDLIYLCFPNNPTGATATREQLAAYVDYARKHRALILFDAAYVSFIRDPDLPHSIFEIPGAETCAVEFRSFSKTAGFTGLRCAFTVIPPTVQAWTSTGSAVALRDLWSRRQTTKFNGASYPIQRAAEAVYTTRGREEVRELTDYYLENARIIRQGLAQAGFRSFGGENAPYVWVEARRPSWDLFHLLLERAGVVTTPGAGFGAAGEGFIRISGFNEREQVERAMERIQAALA